VSRFKRLTDAEARTLTRADLLDRVEAEQAHWFRKRHMTEADQTAYREFSRIMHAYLSPSAAVQAAMDTVEGHGSDYWETRPCDDKVIEVPAALAMDDNQQAGLAYGLRMLARTAEFGPGPPPELEADEVEPTAEANPLASGPDLPTLADLEAATSATAAVLADPAATAADRIAAAEAEEATLLAYARRPEAEAVLQAGT
jgi:hypothetical protein